MIEPIPVLVSALPPKIWQAWSLTSVATRVCLQHSDKGNLSCGGNNGMQRCNTLRTAAESNEQ